MIPLLRGFILSTLRVPTHVVKKNKFTFSYDDFDIQIHICYYLPKLSNKIYSLTYYKVTASSFSILVKTREITFILSTPHFTFSTI